MHISRTGGGRSRTGPPWVVAFFACLGVAALVARAATATYGGGGAGLLIARLGLVLPMLVVCVMTALVAFRVAQLSVSSRRFWWATFVAGAIGTLAIPFLAMGKSVWSEMILPGGPPGLDFRVGLYDPAVAFSSASSAWPPLTLIFGRPFTLLSPDSGYAVYTALVVVLGVAASALCADLGMRSARGPGAEAGERRACSLGLFSLLGFWLFTSYGFLFEAERGNMNVIALFFALLSVWWLLRFPASIWVPAIFLAIAIGLKIYPGILLVLLFWRHRWRAALPVVVANAALLLVTGPHNLWLFLENNINMQSEPSLWVGNHSAVSFAHCVHAGLSWFPVSTKYLFIAIPIVLWAVTAVCLLRQGWSQRGAVLLAAASVPLMNVLTPVSHDYKLVLLVFPLAVFVALVMSGASLGSPALRTALGGLVAFTAVALHGSTTLWAYSNKYPLIVLVQVLLLVVVMLLRREAIPERGQVAPSEAGAGAS